MRSEVWKNLITIGFLIICFGLFWLLNQKKNFNPVLSFQTNLSFKSKKNLNYSDLASSFEVLKLLQKKELAFTLKPTMKEIIGDLPNENKQFGELGRIITNSREIVTVYEYATPDKARIDFEKLKPYYLNQNVLYKNIIINFNSEGETLSYIKEQLK